MTQEEKARAYDEALEIAKGFHKSKEGIYVLVAETIFPELRESEDERIRKWLYDLIDRMSYDNLTKEEAIKNENWKKKVLAYIEKQKEPHYTKRNALFDKCVENCDPATMKRVSDEVDEMLEEEQKPAGWDELQADFRNINEAFEDGKKEVIAHPEKYDLCKPAEWSEEDEEMLNNIEYILHKDISYTPPTKPNSCTGYGNAYYTHQTEIDWLKSLRGPKSSDNWKPSEEQMKALQNAIALTACDKELVRLYNQLKKL